MLWLSSTAISMVLYDVLITLEFVYSIASSLWLPRNSFLQVGHGFCIASYTNCSNMFQTIPFCIVLLVCFLLVVLDCALEFWRGILSCGVELIGSLSVWILDFGFCIILIEQMFFYTIMLCFVLYCIDRLFFHSVFSLVLDSKVS